MRYLNKKLIYIFVFLVLGLFVISACEQAVGRRIYDKGNKARIGCSNFEREIIAYENLCIKNINASPDGYCYMYYGSPRGMNRLEVSNSGRCSNPITLPKYDESIGGGF